MSGRKTITVVITDDKRDLGKIFIITEMPASQAEKWAARALFALAKSGTVIPDNVIDQGWAGIAILGLKMLGNMQFAEAEGLMDEMFRCVKIQPDPGNPNIVRNLIESDIEEVQTRVQLRAETLTLHMGFSLADAQSKLTSATKSRTSSTTRTSRAPSARSSRRAKPASQS